MMETTGAYKITPHGDYHFHRKTTFADKGSAPFHARYHPLTVNTTRPVLRLPERSPGIRTCPPANYMYGDPSAMNSDMDHSLPSGAGVPPIASHQQSQAQANQLTQSRSSTSPSATPQNMYPAPHQDALGAHSRPSDAPFISSPPYPSPPPFGHRTTYASPQYLLPHTHPPSHMAPSSNTFSFPHHSGTPGREASRAHLPYATPSMISVLQHPYQRHSTDPTSPSHQTYAAGTTVTAYPTYSHSPPPSSHSPMAHRQASTSPSGERQHSPSYPSPGTYSPVGYTTPPPFIYTHPTSFVPAPSIYGSHYHPPHYTQPYGSPPLQENQGVWWYPPPGNTAGGSSFGEPMPGFRSQIDSDYPSPVLQRENEQPGQMGSVSPPHNLSPTGDYSSRSRLGSPSDIKPESPPATAHLTPPSNSDSQTKTENPPSRDSGSDWHQKRRSYHPKTPADRSEWVMWAGNVPSDATTDELHNFFNRPPPPLSPGRSGSPMKSQRVYGGVSSVFLIARSNCAFVNFETEAHLEAATARFHGEPVRLDDPRCPRLVCRVRKRTDDLKAGVGAQRGNGIHVKWVNEQKAKAQSEGAESPGLLEGAGRSSPLSISDNDGEGRPPSSCSSRSGSLASTDSGILERYFPQRYFILKSLTQYDLDLSVQRNVWATQPHNEEILDRAYRTSKDVYLFFSVNKSGEFYGCARMAGPIQQSEDRVPWACRPTSPASAPLSRVSMVGEVKDNVPSLPESTSHPPEGLSSGRVLVSSAPAKLDGFHSDIPYSAKFTTTGPPRANAPLKSQSLELDADAPYRAMRDSHHQNIHEGAHPSDPVSPNEHEVSEHALDAALQTIREVPAKLGDGPKDASGVWGRPFRVDWIRTTHLPFIRTRHLRNPWNHGREVKVSRDGTEVEPSIGRQLLEEWDKAPPSPIDDTTASSRSTQRRRGPKSTQYVV